MDMDKDRMDRTDMDSGMDVNTDKDTDTVADP
jgi:hypothetical protein